MFSNIKFIKEKSKQFEKLLDDSLLLSSYFDNNHLLFNDYNSKIDVTETEININISVPGYIREELDIKLNNGILAVTSKTERDFPFKRDIDIKYKIMREVDEQKIEAKLENGILNLIIPFSNNNKSLKQIEIK